MSKLTSNQVKAVGEHYVFSRLTFMGLIVGLPPDNTKEVDILAMSEDGKKNFQVQVKTRRESNSDDWYMNVKHESIERSSLFYVFVSVPKDWTTDNQPETFIIPSKKVAEILRRSHQDWLSTPGRNGRQRNDTKMRRIKFVYPDSPSISDDWMEKYRDNWTPFN